MTGAGDTVIATLADHAAGLIVGKLSTLLSAAELLGSFKTEA